VTRPTVIATYTGKLFPVFDPDVTLIDPIDIAHALSQQCRYTGHTKFHYAVATHACIAHDLCLMEGGTDEEARECLHHDDEEAYLLDLPAPLKKHPGFADQFIELAARLEEAIAIRFGLATPLSPIVKEIDIKMRADEKRQLFPHGTFDCLEEGEIGKQTEGYDFEIPEWTCKQAEYEYLARLERHGDLVVSPNFWAEALVNGRY